MSLRESVDIVITPETKSVQLQNFGLMLIVGPNVNASARTVAVASASEAEDYLAGGAATPEYLAVEAAFGQQNAPAVVKLGSMVGTRTLTFSGTMSAGTIKGTVNGNSFSTGFSSGVPTTLGNLATAIAAADTVNVQSAVYSEDAIVITPKTGKVLGLVMDLSLVTGSLSCAITASATEAIATALSNIQLYDDAWYQLRVALDDASDVLAVAAWVESSSTTPKFYGMASSDPNNVNESPAADTTSIFHQLLALARRRTIGFFSGTAGRDNGQYVNPTAPTEDLAAAVFGVWSGLAPGSFNMAYLQPAGVTPDSLSVQQEMNSRGYYANGIFIPAKECNTFETEGGFNIIRWGRTFSGDWADLVVFQDWLVSSLIAAVFGTFANAGRQGRKVSYDYKGFAAIEGAMETVFKQGQKNGAITDYAQDANGNQIGGYKITFPSLGDVDPNDKTARVLKNVTWECWATDGINSVKMSGTITQ